MLRCTSCGRTYPETFRLTCECGGTLLVEREPPGGFAELLKPRADMRRYSAFLPVHEEYLPELVPALTPVVETEIGGVHVSFKLEYLQPTGSFKDRGTYVTVAKLKEEGITEVVLDSSGNAALSLAAFSLGEGLSAHIFLPERVSAGKLSLLRRLGVGLHLVPGPREEAHAAAVEFARENGMLYVSHWLNPYFLEGTKTAAFETYEQVGVPDYVLAPTGSGSLFLGLWKGFFELRKMGEIGRMPSFVAVQAGGYESLCPRSGKSSELAEGIAIPSPPRLDEMKRVLRKSGGSCVSVGDGEIGMALRWLWNRGFLVEPTSATVLAAFWRLHNTGFIERGSGVLLPLTGSGLKSPPCGSSLQPK